MRRIPFTLIVISLACSPDTPPPAPPTVDLATRPAVTPMRLAWPHDSQPWGSVRLAVLADGTMGILFMQGGPPFLSLYDSTGALVARTGKQGEGPGEFSGMGQLLAGPDFFLVIDNGRAMAVKYSSTGKSVDDFPMQRPGFALAVVHDSIDEFDAELMLRREPAAVVRYALAREGSRVLVTDQDSLLRRALGLPFDRPKPSPPPAWYANSVLTIWGDGMSYELALTRRGMADTTWIRRDIPANRRGPLGLTMMRAAIEAMPTAARGPRGQRIPLPDPRVRLDTLERERLPHFIGNTIGTDAVGRILVAGSTGDSAFVDIFANATFLGREVIDCFTPATIAINHGWIAMQCRDRDPDNRTYTMRLFHVHDAGS